LGDGLLAGEGDLVLTRRNDRTLHLSDGTYVRNGTHWTLHTIHPDNTATLHQRDGLTVTVPSDYLREHVELGYASTIHRAQGLTVDHAHILTTPTLTREALYVAMTRGQHTNHAYIPTDQADPGCAHLPDPGINPPTGIDVLTRILATTGRESSATETRRARETSYLLPAAAATLAAAAAGEPTWAPNRPDAPTAIPYGGGLSQYPDLDPRPPVSEGLSR